MLAAVPSNALLVLEETVVVVVRLVEDATAEVVEVTKPEVRLVLVVDGIKLVVLRIEVTDTETLVDVEVTVITVVTLRTDDTA